MQCPQYTVHRNGFVHRWCAPGNMCNQLLRPEYFVQGPRSGDVTSSRAQQRAPCTQLLAPAPRSLGTGSRGGRAPGSGRGGRNTQTPRRSAPRIRLGTRRRSTAGPRAAAAEEESAAQTRHALARPPRAAADATTVPRSYPSGWGELQRTAQLLGSAAGRPAAAAGHTTKTLRVHFCKKRFHSQTVRSRHPFGGRPRDRGRRGGGDGRPTLTKWIARNASGPGPRAPRCGRCREYSTNQS